MKRVVGTVFLGIFTALFGFVFWTNWQRYDTSETRFLPPGSGRYVLTTFDRLALLGALTIVCGLFFLANLRVLFAADEPESVDANDPKQPSSPDAGPSWKCPGCGGALAALPGGGIGVSAPARWTVTASTRLAKSTTCNAKESTGVRYADHIDEKLPEAITVGIAYGSFDPSINKRDIDFTAPADGVKPESAGAPAFHGFLKTELIPAIERRYHADPDRRVLFGQSRGGSFVLYSAFIDPDLFWGRIAVNASFEADGDRYFHDGPAATRRDLRLVVTSGTRDRPPLREEAVRWFKRWDGVTDRPRAFANCGRLRGRVGATRAVSTDGGYLRCSR